MLNVIGLADNHIHNCVQAVVLPLNGKMKYEAKSYALNLEAFDALCGQLNAQLENKQFIVGEELSIADSTLAAALKPAFETIIGENEQAKLTNLCNWYKGVSADAKLKKQLKTTLAKERKTFNAEEVAAKLAKKKKSTKESRKRGQVRCQKAVQGGIDEV